VLGGLHHEYWLEKVVAWMRTYLLRTTGLAIGHRQAGSHLFRWSADIIQWPRGTITDRVERRQGGCL